MRSLGLDCVIMRFEKAAILRVLHDEPKFSEMFMAYRVECDNRGSGPKRTSQYVCFSSLIGGIADIIPGSPPDDGDGEDGDKIVEANL